jgi:hypothetical protein
MGALGQSSRPLCPTPEPCVKVQGPGYKVQGPLLREGSGPNHNGLSKAS